MKKETFEKNAVCVGCKSYCWNNRLDEPYCGKGRPIRAGMRTCVGFGFFVRRMRGELKINIKGGKKKANAKRRALNIFDKWNDVTGFVEKNTSYYYELQSIIEDAVECGFQAALEINIPLEDEID